MSRRLKRSRRNRLVGGVCAGIANHLGLNPTLVRFLAVLLFLFMSSVPVLAYGALWLTLPVATADDEPLEKLGVDWQADGLQLSWTGAIAGYSVSWGRWLLSVAGLTGLAWVGAVIGGLVAVFGFGMPGEPTASTLLGLGMLFTPFLAILGVLSGWSARTYTATITHDALWVDRPLRQPERIDPGSIDKVTRGGRGLRIHLNDGTVYALPNPPEDEALETFLAEIRRARQRMLTFQSDLEQADAQRADLQRLMARETEAP